MKIKSFLSLLFLASAACSCQKMSEQDMGTTNKTITFKVDFNVSQTPMSRAGLGDHIKTLVVYDYVDGVLKNEITQSSTDTGFGTVKIDASYGTHSLIFVGHNSQTCTYDAENSLLSFDKVLDTFTAYQTITVNGETKGTQAITMDRQVAGIRLAPTDAIPSNAESITITIDGYSSKLNPKTGMGSNGEVLTRSWTYANSQIGKDDVDYLIFSFLPTENSTIDFDVTVKNTSGGTLSNHSIEDVPIKKNQETVITGTLFTSELNATASVNSTWGENINITL